MTLRRKLLLSLLLTSVSLVALGVTVYVLVTDALMDDARADVADRAAFRADEFDRRLEAVAADLEGVGQISVAVPSFDGQGWNIGVAIDGHPARRIDSERLVSGGIGVADQGPAATLGAFLIDGASGPILVFIGDHDDVERAADVARTDVSGTDVITAVAESERSDVTVAVAQDRADVLQPLGRLRIAIVAALILSVLVVVALANTLGKTISDRIARLCDLTNAIGGGDWTRRAGDFGSDELSDLSASIDKMADRLETDNEHRRQIQDELLHRALHDPLTGLANRVKFLDRLDDALARSQRSGAHIAVLFCDLDNLKEVNDQLGHTAGDDLLIGVAARFTSLVRRSDTVARFGGDEFVVLCAEMASAEDASVIAERLSSALIEPFEIAGVPVRSTASIGIVVSSGDSADADELVRDADAAMYVAKEGGKARYVVHADSISDRATRREERSNELTMALCDGQLRLEYQPVLELQSGRLTHVESFVRWDHPDRGLVGPEELLAQFRESAAVIDLDRWVLNEAVGQLAVWNRSRGRRHRVPLTINVSGEFVQAKDMAEEIGEALRRHMVDPCQMKIEVGETALADDPGIGAQNLDLVRSLGVGLVLDDFGTGHMSIEHLRRFGFSVMKIDGTLVETLDLSHDHSPMVAALALAAALEMTAVAEGVERVEQVPELLRHGCAYGQGHLFSPSVGPAGLERWLDRLEV